MTIDGQQATIGAVLREDFSPQLPAPAWRPGLDQADVDAYRGMALQPPPKVITATTAVQLYLAIAELDPGVPIEQARAELETIHAREWREHPTPFGPSQAVVTPLGERLVGRSRFALEREFPDGSPVGRRIKAPWVNNGGLGTVVGVVSDLKYAQIDADITPEVFFH